MEKTLYEILGVEKGAPKAVIKAAYRRLAQRLHPDKGTGNADEFHLVQEAYEVLIDIERRARYDATGTYRHESRQTEEERVNAFAMNAMAALLHKIIEGTDFVDHTDIIGLLRDEVVKLNENDKGDLARYEKAKAKHEKAMARIKVSEGDNFAALAIARVISEIDAKIRNEKDNIKIGERLLEILELHEYEVEPMDDETKEAQMRAEKESQMDALAQMLSRGFRFPGGL